MKSAKTMTILPFALVAAGLMAIGGMLQGTADISVGEFTWSDVAIVGLGLIAWLCVMLGMAMAVRFNDIRPTLLGTAGAGAMVIAHDGSANRLLLVAAVFLAVMIPTIIRTFMQSRKATP